MTQDFRYAQFCPLARATEVLGERWTLLIVRELLLGPKRFSDVRRALSGVSPSVLARRLARLERRGLVVQRTLEPPAASTVYELDEGGRALLPVVVELARWGARFLGPPRPEERIDPDWVRLGCYTFARRADSPARRYQVTVADDERESVFVVEGDSRGTHVRAGSEPAETSLVGAPLAVLALLSGSLDPREAVRAGMVRAEGDLDAVVDFPRMFDMNPSQEENRGI